MASIHKALRPPLLISFQLYDAVTMPISYICQSNASAINSDLSKTPNGRALLSYLNQHGSDSNIPCPPVVTSTAAASQHHQPFSLESLFGARSPLLNAGLGLFAQLLNPQLSENAGMMHVGSSDPSDGNAGRAVVVIMRGQGQQSSLNAGRN